MFSGFITPAPKLGMPFTCDSAMYTKSCGFRFRMWGHVCSMSGDVGGPQGVGVSMYALFVV